jgi:hypothetical protein
MTEMTTEPAAEMTTQPATAPGKLSEADFHGCRFIEGEVTPLRSGIFCCATPAEPGGAWCARHRKIVWAYRRGAAVRRPEAPKPSLH